MFGAVAGLDGGACIVDAGLRIEAGRDEPPIVGVDGVPSEKFDYGQAAAFDSMIQPGIPIGGWQRLVFAGFVITEEELNVLIEQSSEFR